MQSLCTLQTPRCRDARNTRYRAARYSLTRTGLAPVGSRQLRLAHRVRTPYSYLWSREHGAGAE
ncbi:MAG TPA: hypothetical protein VFD73_17880, partial [Gemmatimonadales bacterium]|nr:hypothetical protein [Gemmatimonadales bacterium]